MNWFPSLGLPRLKPLPDWKLFEVHVRQPISNARSLKNWTPVWVSLVVGIMAANAGCRMTREQAFQRMAYVASFGPQEVVTVKPVREKGRLDFVKNYFARRAEPSERTKQLLRKYNLLDYQKKDPQSVIRWLGELVANEPSIEEVHALAELSEIEANWLNKKGEPDQAIKYFTTAVIHSYQFLFAPRLNIARNAYDPQFRSICDIYNRSLEGLLRQVCREGKLIPGQSLSIGAGENRIEVAVEIVGRWKNQEFEKFDLANDYQTEGLDNRFQTYGLGVPLIAVRKQREQTSPIEDFYPPNLTLALTAFGHLRPNPKNPDSGELQAVLTLYDPLENKTVDTGGQQVPLESNITTPLAYYLRDPLLNTGVLETISLVNAELTPELYGMYMLEPYDPNKIPVVMVHGLWSSPLTWVEMFNDLRANPEIHANYQFWFYAYPTGQPFWFSAQQMREDLAQIKSVLDPQGTSMPLNQMILVGHSMGGLISTMQTIDSGENFWNLVSDKPLASFEGSPEGIQKLKETFYFQPNPSISRVITIATPFQGSSFANDGTRWASRKLFTLPEMKKSDLKKVAEQNQDKLIAKDLLLTATSLDSLATDAPVFLAIGKSQSPPQVKHHNVYGKVPKKRWINVGSSPTYVGDGVVSLESSRNPRAVSNLAVEIEHSDVHQSTACIYEVRRILLENLVELARIQGRNIPVMPQMSDQQDGLQEQETSQQ